METMNRIRRNIALTIENSMRILLMSVILSGYISATVATAKNLTYIKKLVARADYSNENVHRQTSASPEQKLPNRRHLPLTKRIIVANQMLTADGPVEVDNFEISVSPYEEPHGVPVVVLSSPADRAPPAL